MTSIFWADLRYAFRLLRRSPGFYLLVIGFVAAGIGAICAVFSIVHAMLLRPLPFPSSDALTVVRTTAPWVEVGKSSRATLPDFLDWKAQATAFERMAAIRGESFGLASEGAKPERVAGLMVSGDFFPLLGVRALHGRLLGPEDDRVGGPCVVVVSTSLWRRRFAADPALVGRAITLNGVRCSVAGIAPEGFRFSDLAGWEGAEVWTPLAVTLSDYARMSAPDRSFEGFYHFLNVFGRRKPGVSLESGRAELTAIASRLGKQYPKTNGKKSVLVMGLQDFLVRPSRSRAWVLFACVGLVFLIVCANVANLMLTRAQGRRPEMAARIALGATRARLAAQLLTETAFVLLLASAAGIVLANFLLELFAAAVVAPRVAFVVELELNAVALGVSIAGCLAVGLTFAIAPALATAHVEPQTVLRESAARTGTSRAQRAVRNALVVAQVALALALLAGSGLAAKAFEKLATTPLGFEPEKLATATVILPEARYPGGGAPDYKPVERVVQFYRAALARVAAQPGVESVTINTCVPLDCGAWAVAVEGHPPSRPLGTSELGFNVVTPGYFHTMKIPLLRGRDFTERDRGDARLVAILSQRAAEILFPGQDPIGRRIDSGLDEYMVWREVVGIVGNVRSAGLDAPVGIDGYFPLEQVGSWNRKMTLLARSDRAEAVLQEIPRSIAAIDPEQDVTELALMEEHVADSIQHQRLLAALFAAFAIFAMLLAAVGLFGLISYTTAQRTRELGIRLALGSMPERVVGLVLASGLRLLAAGLAIGLVLAFAVGRILAGEIQHVSSFDVGIFTSVSAILGLVGILGCLIPAWRAALIAPAQALRYE